MAPRQAERIDPAVLETAEIHLISGNYQEEVVGQALGETLVAMVVDAQGRPLAGAPVRWTFGAGSGGAAGTPDTDTTVTVTSDARGEVMVAWVLGTVAGPQHAWGVVGPASTDGAGATPEGNQVVGFEATAVPDEPAEILVSQSSIEIEEGESISLTAVVVDRYGNEIPDIVVEWATSDSSVVTVESSAAAPGISYVALPPDVAPGSASDEDATG